MDRIIYTKYSNERAKRFALRTDICQDGKTRSVHKRALYPQGQDNIRRIEKHYQELAQIYGNTNIHMNRCQFVGDGLTLEYLDGDTLEHILDGYLLLGDTGRAVECLFAYLEEVKKGFKLEHFEMTPEFEEVFGQADLSEDLLSVQVTDIDMVLNNVLVDEGWTLIDYEWTFDFPVPYQFVAYRILTYYLHGSTSRDCLHPLNLFQKAGITEEDKQVFEKMERHFQEVYVVSEENQGEKHVPIRELYEAISPGTLDLTGLGFAEQSERAARLVQLYQSQDMNFTEEGSEQKELQEEGIFSDTFSIWPDSTCVRLDPASKCCAVQKLKMQWGDEIKEFQTNGFMIGEDSILFPTEDPQIVVKCPGVHRGDFQVSFEITYLTMTEAIQRIEQIGENLADELSRVKKVLGQKEEQIIQMEEQTRQKEVLLEQKENLIHTMENTKIWKAYRKIKRD